MAGATAFWLSFLTLGAVYVAYPVVLAAVKRVAPRPLRAAFYEPDVTIVIAAFNEERTIDRKIRTCMRLDYPREKIQIVIALDGSTDGTEWKVRPWERHGVEVVRLPRRRGKAAAINLAMERARGDVVLFQDARQELDPGALRVITSDFADESVGSVSGRLVILDTAGRVDDGALGLYWRYESWLRESEARIHSMLGATGAIYAIRRAAFEPIPEDTILDDVLIPMRIVLAGKRAIFESRALAFDRVAPSPEAEFTRKVRTLMGNYQLISRLPELLVPGRNPVAGQFLMHKVGRLVAPYCLLALLVSASFLDGALYRVFFGAELAFYACAIAGWAISRLQPPVRGEVSL